MAITVTRTSVLAAPTTPAAVTGASAGDLTNGKTYYYRVIAVKSGNFPEFGLATDEFSAAADANGSIDLSWDAVVGATGYMVFRTPTTGDYSFTYLGSGVSLSHDTHCMYLRNNRTYSTRTYTTTGVTLTDLGSTTERPNGYSYYRDWMNFKFPSKAQCTITVSGGTLGTEASFDDVYTASVAGGWDAVDRHFGSDNLFRCFEFFDNLIIGGHFADDSFFIRLHGDLDASTDDSGLRRFGNLITGTEATICGSSFVVRSLNRTYSSSLRFRNTNLYGTIVISDGGEVTPALQSSTRSSFYSNSGSVYIYDNTTFLNNYIDYQCQNLSLNGTTGISINQLKQYGVDRGFSLSADQSTSTLNNIRLSNISYEVTFNVGGTTNTFSNAIFYKNTNLFRFFGASIINAIGNLVDPVFYNGHGLPGSASQGGSAHTNYIQILYGFDLKVIYVDGTTVEGASVTITNGQSEETNLTTDVSGNITHQHLIAQKAYRSTATDGVFDTLTDYSDYSMEIIKGNHRYFSYFTLDGAKNFTITLADNDVCFSVRRHRV